MQMQLRAVSVMFLLSPGGVDGVTDGDDVTGPAHIQVRPREGDEAGVSHSVLVPRRDARMNQDSGATGSACGRPPRNPSHAATHVLGHPRGSSPPTPRQPHHCLRVGSKALSIRDPG